MKLETVFILISETNYKYQHVILEIKLHNNHVVNAISIFIGLPERIRNVNLKQYNR